MVVDRDINDSNLVDFDSEATTWNQFEAAAILEEMNIERNQNVQIWGTISQSNEGKPASPAVQVWFERSRNRRFVTVARFRKLLKSRLSAC